MNDAKTDVLCACPLFARLGRERVERDVIPRGRTEVYAPGTEIPLVRERGEGAVLCVLLCGKAAVYAPDTQKLTLMRFAGPSQSLGAAGLFASAPIRTRVRACGDGPAEVFVMDTAAVTELIRADADGVFTSALLSFLSDRVAFLNRRIACVTGGTAERKLACYLLSCPCEDGRVCVGMSMKALAQALDLGRASLYRAFDVLTDRGILSRNGDEFTLLSPEKLNALCGTEPA